MLSARSANFRLLMTGTPSHADDCIKSMSEYVLQNVPDWNLAGFKIWNIEDMVDTPGGVSFCRRDQIQGDLIC